MWTDGTVDRQKGQMLLWFSHQRQESSKSSQITCSSTDWQKLRKGTAAAKVAQGTSQWFYFYMGPGRGVTTRVCILERQRQWVLFLDPSKEVPRAGALAGHRSLCNTSTNISFPRQGIHSVHSPLTTPSNPFRVSGHKRDADYAVIIQVLNDYTLTWFTAR